MNGLQIIKYGNIDTVDSREVAEMIGKQHKHLLADIRGYIAAMENSGEPKIRPSDFFVESTFTNSQNKEQPCYLLTKKGCDMVANKMTGQKGVQFTAAYINTFEAMREHIEERKSIQPKTAMEMLRLQSAAMIELDERVNSISDKLDNQMTIDHGQQRTLQETVSRRAYERTAVVFPASEVKSRASYFFRAIYHDIKTRFGVASYRDIRPVDYKNAVDYVNGWIEPAKLREKEGSI